MVQWKTTNNNLGTSPHANGCYQWVPDKFHLHISIPSIKHSASDHKSDPFDLRLEMQNKYPFTDGIPTCSGTNATTGTPLSTPLLVDRYGACPYTQQKGCQRLI